MSVPLMQKIRVGAYLMKQRLTGNKRYPLVLMLEPLFRCNLACAGCGKIDYPDEILNKRLTPEECFQAVDECGAPVVSIPGGEPLLHKEIVQIVEGIIARMTRKATSPPLNARYGDVIVGESGLYVNCARSFRFEHVGSPQEASPKRDQLRNKGTNTNDT